MPNFSSLARLEVPEKFVWWWVGGVCKVIFMSNPTIVLRLRLGWGFDNYTELSIGPLVKNQLLWLWQEMYNNWSLKADYLFFPSIKTFPVLVCWLF